MAFIRENKIEVIGKIVEMNINKGTNDRGDYMYGDVVVEVKKPKLMRIPLSFFMNALKKGTTEPNKVYAGMLKLSVGDRVNVVGSIGDNKFWSAASGQLIKSKRLNINFINLAREGETDKAQFSFAGFVSETLKEKFDKDQKLIGYTVKLAQSDYNATRAVNIPFNLDINNTKVVRYIESEFKANKTFRVTGELDYNVESVEVREEVDFGEPIVRTYQRNISNLIITGGSEVSVDSYILSDIDMLLEGDKAHDNQTMEDQKNKERSGEAVSTNKPASTKGVAESLL